MAGKFEIRDRFYVDGEPVQLISGGIHYFRVVPEYWRDRLEKLKNMGCNTVETYVPWNLHEPKKGNFCFTGIADVKKFIQIAGELGLYVIVRPSPYICAEWEFGGLPAWLLAEDGMKLRCSYPPFLKHVEDYYKELFRILSPLQFDQSGSIILMQLENEYGSYGEDKEYLKALKKMMTDNGLTVPLVTSDGPWEDYLACGTLPDVHPTANFGSAAERQLKVLEEYTNGPRMCMEFWVGWFDAWGNNKHATSELEKNIEDLRYFAKNDNVNIYMFEGGTNFGFMNGSNYYDKLTPDVTSYDYDAVLTEGGELTEKYRQFQKVLKETRTLPNLTLSTKIQKKAYGVLQAEAKTGLFENLDCLSTPVSFVTPVCMEKLGQNYGYVLYESELASERNIQKIRLTDTNDRAQVFIEEDKIATLYDRELLQEHTVERRNINQKKLRILVENMGRVNYGPLLEKQRKGIDGGVLLNGHFHFHWKSYPLPMEHLECLDFNKGYTKGLPAFYRFTLQAEEACDTYIDVTGWGKGCIIINGFVLGRFWEIGPQKRLYLPAPLIRKGKNEIIVFETEGKALETITLEEEAKLE